MSPVEIIQWKPFNVIANNDINWFFWNQMEISNLLLYKCAVAKLGSKAGNFLSGNRGER
jgi:hypothetical protein